MGCRININYEDYYNVMVEGEWMTAKQIGAAAASLRAMCNRGLIEVDTSAKPMRYRKISGSGRHFKVLAALNSCHNQESGLATIWFDHRALGEMVELKNDGKWYHFDGKTQLDAATTAHVVKVNYYLEGEIAQEIIL